MSTVIVEPERHERRRSRVKLKSYSMLMLCLMAIGFTIWSALARMFVCWGHDIVSMKALFGCHGAHWSVVGTMGLLIVLMAFLVLELGENHRLLYQGQNLRTLRAAAHGYRRGIDRHEQIVSGTATALVVMGVAVVLIFLFSNVRL